METYFLLHCTYMWISWESTFCDYCLFKFRLLGVSKKINKTVYLCAHFYSWIILRTM